MKSAAGKRRFLTKQGTNGIKPIYKELYRLDAAPF